jgi:7-cyano-7-deazaguanine synthase
VSNKAIILLSGGIDSALILALALKSGRQCHALSFDYNQRHRIELESAAALAAYYRVSHHVIGIDPKAFAKSSLVNREMQQPTHRDLAQIIREGIPSTYVPARNTIFLAFAMGQAEIHEAQEIFYGANALDILPYPDCSPKYVASFQSVLDIATRQAREGKAPRLITPLIEWDKREIIRQATLEKVPFALTMSCYDPKEGKHCGICDACMLRREGFKLNGFVDPTSYTYHKKY